MDAILDFFSSIWAGLCSIFDFIAFLAKEIVQAVKMVGQALVSVTHYIGFLPSLLAVTILTVVTITVIFKLKS